VTGRALCARCGEMRVGYVGRDCCYGCVPHLKPGARVRLCPRCGTNPIGYPGRACCFDCVPRRRRAPLACKRCSAPEVWTSGLCRRCHRLGPLVDSCQDCLAWGVTRHNTWICQACRGWRRRYTPASCPGCDRSVAVNHRGFCRLCCRQATTRNQLNPAHATLDVAELGRDGQQLFLADLILKKRGKQPGDTPAPPLQRASWPNRFPVDHQQLLLFAWSRTLTNVGLRTIVPPLPDLAAALALAVAEHGDRHGWTGSQRVQTARGIRVLLAFQDTPGARITTTEADVLLVVENATVRPVLDVLAAVDMLVDDRRPPLQTWFEHRTSHLPGPILEELRSWFLALRDGSTTPPRMRPRQLTTVRSAVTAVLPALDTWADAGHDSLREISRHHVLDAVNAASSRSMTLTALRGLFRYLKARKITFVNPTLRIRHDRPMPMDVQTIDLDAIRDALNSDDPARAALAALVAFHALRNGQLRRLHLVDVQDGRLHVDANTIVLADPVRRRLNTWLAERGRRWPGTANPHLFISARTAVRTSEVSAPWIIDKLGVRPQTIRQDRILQEAIATNGDVRRLADLFGISISTAQRYTEVITRPDEHALEPQS
jgi:site-specific recombinase XerD